MQTPNTTQVAATGQSATTVISNWTPLFKVLGTLFLDPLFWAAVIGLIALLTVLGAALSLRNGGWKKLASSAGNHGGELFSHQNWWILSILTGVVILVALIATYRTTLIESVGPILPVLIVLILIAVFFNPLMDLATEWVGTLGKVVMGGLLIITALLVFTVSFLAGTGAANVAATMIPVPGLPQMLALVAIMGNAAGTAGRGILVAAAFIGISPILKRFNASEEEPHGEGDAHDEHHKS